MAKNFINNSDMLVEIKLSQARKCERPDDQPGSWITDKLAEYYMVMVDRYGRAINWKDYTYNEEMRGCALIALIKGGLKFDCNKGSNPFAFFTTIMYRAFLGYHYKEKTQRKIRDGLLIDAGKLPSCAAQEEDKESEPNT